MPTDSQHIQLAIHNIDTAKYLIEKKVFNDWVAVVLFYASLHIIDAVFFCDPKISEKHGRTHNIRRDILRGVTHYTNISRHYSPMYRIANIARYIEDRRTGSIMAFDVFMPADELEGELIKRHFWQILKSSSNFLP